MHWFLNPAGEHFKQIQILGPLSLNYQISLSESYITTLALVFYKPPI